MEPADPVCRFPDYICPKSRSSGWLQRGTSSDISRGTPTEIMEEICANGYPLLMLMSRTEYIIASSATMEIQASPFVCKPSLLHRSEMQVPVDRLTDAELSFEDEDCPRLTSRRVSVHFKSKDRKSRVKWHCSICTILWWRINSTTTTAQSVISWSIHIVLKKLLEVDEIMTFKNYQYLQASSSSSSISEH